MAKKVQRGDYPEFMVRVKLPSSGGYHCSPSGDTEYEEAYNAAIMAAKPDGYEVIWPRIGEKWPVDSEGYTWVRLRCTDGKAAVAYWTERCRLAEKELKRIKNAVSGNED